MGTVPLPSLMKNVSFHLLLLFVQIYFASQLEGSSFTGEGSHVGHLMKTKSGKVFLTRSSKKDAGDNSNFDETKESSGADYYGKRKSYDSQKSKSYGSQKSNSYGSRKSKSYGSQKSKSYGSKKRKSYGSRKPRIRGSQRRRGFKLASVCTSL